MAGNRTVSLASLSPIPDRSVIFKSEKLIFQRLVAGGIIRHLGVPCQLPKATAAMRRF